MRLFWLFVVVALLLLIPFLFWGDLFAQWFSGDAGVQALRAWGRWGWLAVLALLVADLFLPIPATPVMSAAGYVYGTLIGGILSAAGSFLAGMLGYALCRRFGRRAAVRIAGQKDLARAEELFRQRGAWLVALSRWMPLLPEVVSCLAGLSRMPVRTFSISLACGCVPMGFAYAAIGTAGQQHAYLALVLSAIVPALLWLLIGIVVRLPKERSISARIGSDH